jgi:PAS domain-containing protein
MKVTAQRGIGRDKVAILVQRLASTVKALESLLADETDSVVCPGGESFLLPRSQESLRKSEEAQRQTAELQRTILDAIPAHLAVLDRNGEIIFINESWRRFLGPEGDCEHLEIGQNYLQYCEVADHAFDGMGSKLAAGIRKVLQANVQSYSLNHPVYQDGKSRWYRVTATSLGRSEMNGAVPLRGRRSSQAEVYQVLLNLAINARDAMPDGGTLGISVTNVRLDEHHVSLNRRAAAGAYVRFAVSDNGSNPEKPPQKELPRGNGELVLVIDDEAAIRQIIRQTLETFGYRVLTAKASFSPNHSQSKNCLRRSELFCARLQRSKILELLRKTSGVLLEGDRRPSGRTDTDTSSSRVNNLAEWGHVF